MVNLKLVTFLMGYISSSFILHMVSSLPIHLFVCIVHKWELRFLHVRHVLLSCTIFPVTAGLNTWYLVIYNTVVI